MTHSPESGLSMIVHRRPEVEHKDICLAHDLRALRRDGEWHTHDTETRGLGVDEDLSSIAYSTLCLYKHLEQFRVAAVPAHTDVTWIVRQEVNEEGQDMPRIIRDVVEGVRQVTDSGWRHHWHGDGRLYGLEEDTFRLAQGDFFNDLVSEPPAVLLFRHFRERHFIKKPLWIVLNRVVTVRWGDLPRMIAVIAKQAIQNVIDAAMDQIEALGDVRIDVPPKQHLFVEAVDTQQIGAEDELKIARPVVFDFRPNMDDLMQMHRPPPLTERFKDTLRLFAVE